MVYRLIFFLISFFFVCESYSQQIEKIPIKSAGRKDISFFFVQDLSLIDKLSKTAISKESLTALGFYRAYGEGADFGLLKNILDKEESLLVKKEILFNVLDELRSKEDIDRFYKSFSEYLKKADFEEIRFYYYYKSNLIKDFSGNKASLKALKDAIVFYNNNSYLEALKVIEPFKNNFPRFYTILLIELGRYLDALSFSDMIPEEDSYYFKALSLYYLKRHNKVVEILSNRKLDYKEKILLIESMTSEGNFNIPNFDKEMEKLAFQPDEFYILKSLPDVARYSGGEFREKADIFRLRWEIKNYVYFLSLYAEEINRFQEQLKKMEKDLKSINSRFDTIYDKVKDEERVKEIKLKVIALNELYSKIKNFSGEIRDINKGSFLFFQKEYQKAKEELEGLYKDVAERYQEELKKINIEIHARKLERIIFENKTLSSEDVKNLLTALKDVGKEIDSKGFTIEESTIYYQIYLISELIALSANKPYEERLSLINESITLCENYLKKFKERRSEVMLFLADAYEGIGEYDRALSIYYEYLAEKGDGDFRTYMKIAEILFERREYQRAIKFYEKAAEKAKAYRDAAYYKIGWSYYLSGQYEKVINLFLNYKFESVGQRQELLLNEMIDLLSRAFYKLDNLELVENYLDKNRHFPYPEKVFKYLGDIYLYLANYEKAIAVYKKGWERFYLYKNSYEIPLSIIDAYNFMGNKELAYNQRVIYIKSYGKNSKYYEKYKEFPVDFGEEIIATALYFNALYDKDRNDRNYLFATEFYENLLDYFPSHSRAGEASFMLAQLYEERGDNKRASRLFKQAKELKFNEEESFYRSLYCEYKMWKAHQIISKELINSLDTFIKDFKSSSRYNNVALVLADISLKEGLLDKMFFAIDSAANNNDEGLIKALDFIEANFDGINDKSYIASIFDRGYRRLKDSKYLKLKHFSLFKYASLLEQENKREQAINIYKEILQDEESDFKEFAIFNLSLLLQKLGKTEEAISYMSKIRVKNDLKLKAKEFIYAFGKEKGLYIEAANAALDYASLSPDNKIPLLMESSYLFIKGKNLDNAERVLYQLESLKLSDIQSSEKNIIKGLIFYNRGEYDLAYDLLIPGMKGTIPNSMEVDFEEAVHNVLSKTVFTKPEDEARDALESYVTYLSKKYKEKGDDEYLYKLGDIMNEFALFFLQQEEAKSRSLVLLKRALNNSIEKGNRALIAKVFNKLKAIDPKRYGRTFKIEKLEFNLTEIISHENLFK